jgi:hypothetical protein
MARLNATKMQAAAPRYDHMAGVYSASWRLRIVPTWVLAREVWSGARAGGAPNEAQRRRKPRKREAFGLFEGIGAGIR